MSILTRYLLKAHVGPFLFALGILTGLLLVNTVAKRFEELAGKGLDLGIILEVFFLSLPHIIALTLPMAVLVAVLYTFSQLAADNEINALKSSGVNLVRLLMPLLAASLVLAGFMIWFNDSVLPETNHRLKNLLVDIGRQTPMMELQEQVINEIPTANMEGRYYLHATKIDAATNRLWDVIIYDMSTPGRTRTVYADSGRMTFSPDRTDLYMMLYDGHIHEFESMRPEMFHRLYFHEQRLRIAGVGTQFERTFDAGFRSDREMSASMLAAEVRDGIQQVRQVRDETAKHLEDALRRALTWDGAPAAANPLSDDSATEYAEAALLELETGSTTSGTRGTGEAVARQLGAELRALQSREEMHQYRVNQYRVELHKKFAIPLACVVFVLIGAPLAIRFPRGGAGMVIAISLTIFALYYAALIGGEELGDRGTISPAGAMWAPNTILLIIGIWGLARIGKETATTRGGGWDDLWNTTRRVLARPFRMLRRRAA